MNPASRASMFHTRARGFRPSLAAVEPLRAVSSDFGQLWTACDQVRPNFVGLRRDAVNFRPILTSICQTRSDFDIWSNASGRRVENIESKLFGSNAPAISPSMVGAVGANLASLLRMFWSGSLPRALQQVFFRYPLGTCWRISIVFGPRLVCLPRCAEYQARSREALRAKAWVVALAR